MSKTFFEKETELRNNLTFLEKKKNLLDKKIKKIRTQLNYMQKKD